MGESKDEGGGMKDEEKQGLGEIEKTQSDP